jgi:hypothetical protein
VGRHEGQLVERQRPAGVGRRHERDLLDVALLDVLHEAAQRAAEVAIVDHHRSVQRRTRTGAAGDDERVVGDPLAATGDDAALVGLDRVQRAGHDLGVEVRGDPRQLDPARMGDGERLGHGHRAVVEVALGREQRHANAVAGQRVEGHHGLERRDTAARDEDVEGVQIRVDRHTWRHYGRPARRPSGQIRRLLAGKP